jgi:predicted HicB family RNase H-like nuclease
MPDPTDDLLDDRRAVRIVVKVPSDLHAKLKEDAKREYRTLTSYVRKVLEQASGQPGQAA